MKKIYTLNLLQLFFALTCPVQANFFWGGSGSQGTAASSRSIKPVLDEFIHGSSYYPSLSIDELINYLSLA